MSRGKGMLFALVALTAISATIVAPATAASTDPVAATDERAPEDVSNVTAFPGAAGVEISWELSPSDFVRQSPTGSDFTSGGSFANVNDVAGYAIYRDDVEIDFVDAGVTDFVDLEAAGSTIIYAVAAVDAAGNESDGVEVVISLGAPPIAVVTVPDGDYGNPGLDEAIAQTITIDNDATEADANLTVTITVEGDGFSSADEIVVIEAGASASIDVVFDAAAVGSLNDIYTGSVTIRTNDPDNREVGYATVAEIIDGIGLPEIAIAPAAITFAGQIVDGSYTRTLTISNVGGPTLEGTVSIAGDAAFSISGDGTYSLEGGAAEEVTVTFAPADSVSYSATITVTSNDDDEAATEIAVTGRGSSAAEGPGVIEDEDFIVTTTMSGDATFSDDLTLDLTDQTAVEEALEDEVSYAAIVAALIQAYADAMGIDANRIVIQALAFGSLIVEFEVLPAEDGSDEASPAEALATLETTLADTTTSNPVTSIATVSSVASEIVVEVLVPQDDEGNRVVGWFTQGEFGAQVGFDDFFAFANNFGKTDADANWDVAFDIGSPSGDPDGKVDFDDFFAFADNFGKIVANADDIIAALD